MAENKSGHTGNPGAAQDGAPLKLPTTGTQRQILKEGQNLKVPSAPVNKPKKSGK
jgi:hypothetical protein